MHVLEKAGVTSKDKSFAVCVSDALDILLESSRIGGILPEPDPFQFLTELRYHVGKEAPDRRKKSAPYIQAAKQMTRAPARHETLVPEAPEVEWVDPNIPTDPMKLIEYKEAIKRLTSAQQKKDLAEQGTPGVVWGESDEAAFQRDQLIVYG